MKKILRFKSESGLTLIEVLISTVLLVLILSIFLSVFVQSARVNHSSEEMIDATYAAQREMENIYQISLDGSFEEGFLESNYVKGPVLHKQGKAWDSYEKIATDSGYHLRVRTRAMEEYDTLTRIIVEVFEGNITEDGRNLQAKMENIFEWGSNEK